MTNRTVRQVIACDGLYRVWTPGHHGRRLRLGLCVRGRSDRRERGIVFDAEPRNNIEESLEQLIASIGTIDDIQAPRSWTCSGWSRLAGRPWAHP